MTRAQRIIYWTFVVALFAVAGVAAWLGHILTAHGVGWVAQVAISIALGALVGAPFGLYIVRLLRRIDRP